MAPRPSEDLLRRQAKNSEEAGCLNDTDDQELALRLHENEVNDPQPDAGQRSSVAALPVTNTDDVDDNSNEVAPTEVPIIPSPLYLLIQSFRLIIY